MQMKKSAKFKVLYQFTRQVRPNNESVLIPTSSPTKPLGSVEPTGVQSWGPSLIGSSNNLPSDEARFHSYLPNSMHFGTNGQAHGSNDSLECMTTSSVVLIGNPNIEPLLVSGGYSPAPNETEQDKHTKKAPYSNQQLTLIKPNATSPQITTDMHQSNPMTQNRHPNHKYKPILKSSNKQADTYIDANILLSPSQSLESLQIQQQLKRVQQQQQCQPTNSFGPQNEARTNQQSQLRHPNSTKPIKLYLHSRSQSCPFIVGATEEQQRLTANAGKQNQMKCVSVNHSTRDGNGKVSQKTFFGSHLLDHPYDKISNHTRNQAVLQHPDGKSPVGNSQPSSRNNNINAHNKTSHKKKTKGAKVKSTPTVDPIAEAHPPHQRRNHTNPHPEQHYSYLEQNTPSAQKSDWNQQLKPENSLCGHAGNQIVPNSKGTYQSMENITQQQHLVQFPTTTFKKLNHHRSQAEIGNPSLKRRQVTVIAQLHDSEISQAQDKNINISVVKQGHRDGQIQHDTQGQHNGGNQVYTTNYKPAEPPQSFSSSQRSCRVQQTPQVNPERGLHPPNQNKPNFGTRSNPNQTKIIGQNQTFLNQSEELMPIVPSFQPSMKKKSTHRSSLSYGEALSNTVIIYNLSDEQLNDQRGGWYDGLSNQRQTVGSRDRTPAQFPPPASGCDSHYEIDQSHLPEMSNSSGLNGYSVSAKTNIHTSTPDSKRANQTPSSFAGVSNLYSNAPSWPTNSVSGLLTHIPISNLTKVRAKILHQQQSYDLSVQLKSIKSDTSKLAIRQKVFNEISIGAVSYCQQTNRNVNRNNETCRTYKHNMAHNLLRAIPFQVDGSAVSRAQTSKPNMSHQFSGERNSSPSVQQIFRTLPVIQNYHYYSQEPSGSSSLLGQGNERRQSSQCSDKQDSLDD